MERFRNYIDGRWQLPSSDQFYTRVNPANPSQKLGEFPLSSDQDVGAAVAAAVKSAESWALMPGPERASLLVGFAELLEAAKEELGRIITLEQGKALGEGIGEVSRAVAEARYMAGEANRMLGETFPSEYSHITSHTVLEPLGVVAAVSPWNFPVVTPVRKIVPALAFGNTVVFKPASHTPRSGLRLIELFNEAGFPPGVINLVIGGGSSVGKALVADSRVDGISFTGSTEVGLEVYKEAARRNAKVQLEMGGKNAAVVWDYQNLDRAAEEIVSAAFLCSGQRCTALSRVIVSEDQGDSLVECLTERIKKIRVGSGMDKETTMGPLVSEQQLHSVCNFVQQGKERGAQLVAGGRILVADPQTEGYYFAPTLFDHVDEQSPLARDEIFGPVLPVIRVRTFDDAIRVANDTRYGLAGSFFCDTLGLIHRFVERAKVGIVHVNHGTRSQAHVPFGGVKSSGQGAYSIGPTARAFYTNVKVIYVSWD